MLLHASRLEVACQHAKKHDFGCSAKLVESVGRPSKPRLANINSEYFYLSESDPKLFARLVKICKPEIASKNALRSQKGNLVFQIGPPLPCLPPPLFCLSLLSILLPGMPRQAPEAHRLIWGRMPMPAIFGNGEDAGGKGPTCQSL